MGYARSVAEVRRTLVSCAALCIACIAQAEETVEFRIPPQPLETAILAFADQTGAQVATSSDSIADLKTKGVSGRLTPRSALEQLIAGSDLEIRSEGEHSFSLLARPGTRGSEGAHAASDATSSPSREAAPSNTEKSKAEENTTSRNTGGAGGDSPAAVIIEEIIVTAQKREERLFDVPQSVTVLSDESLNRLGATQFRDFANTIPGLNFNTTGAGFTQIALRGITTGYDVGQTVAIYVDEVPYGSSTNVTGSARRALDVGLFDLDRIEVLKGPQGTLYGASAMGGLIKYVTRSPDTTSFGAELRTGVSSTHEGDVSYNGAGTLNVPLSDQTAMRLTGFYSHDGGFVDNLSLAREDVDRATISGGRADLLFAPNDAFSIRLSGFLQDISRDGQATADYSFSTNKPLWGDELSQRRLVPEPFDQSYRLISATANYNFGPATLTSISSYQTVESDVLYDLSVVFLPILASTGRTNYSAIGFKDDVNTDKFVQELRVANNTIGRWDWVLGGFYTKEDSDFDQSILPVDLAGQPVSDNLLLTLTPSTYEEYAAFGNVTWRLNEKFDVSGGLRFARNREETMRVGSGLFGTSRPLRKSDDDVLTYLANARYHLSENAIAYVRYSTGYRPGGVNFVLNDPITGEPIADPTYDADTLDSYEIGFKGQTEDRRYDIDVSLFYIDWSDIQITAVRNGVGTRINAPDGATVQGVELGFTTRPSDSLSIVGAAAYQDATMNEANADIRAAKGERLPNVPRVTATLGADYLLSQGPLEPSLGATLRYVSDRNANFAAALAPPQYPLSEYLTVDLRAALTVGRVVTQIFVRNVFDERSELAMFNWNSTYAQAAVLQPRTVGLTATMRF